MDENNKNIYLIDGNSLCYRAFYAIQDLRSSKGVPTNAIYGFISILRKLFKGYSPKRMAVVFDSKGPTERHKKFEEYKIHRKPMPEELIGQLGAINEVVTAHNIPIFQLAGYEADDIIATLAENATREGYDVTIVSNDKDALQLVGGGVKVLSLHTAGDVIYDKQQVIDKFGVPPEKMVDLMALMGDQSDNIPGVRGIGQVTAEKLIKEFGSLSAIYANLAGVKSDSVRGKLKEGEAEAVLSLDLARLNKTVPLIEFNAEKTVIGEPDKEKLAKLYEEFEFRKLLHEVLLEKNSEKEKGKYIIVEDPDLIKKSVGHVDKTGHVAFSLVKDPGDGNIQGFTFSYKEEEAFYISFKGDLGTIALVKKIFENADICKIGYDIKQDLLDLNREGIELKGPIFDILIADYLIDPSRSVYDISSISVRYLNYSILDEKNTAGWDKKGQATMDFSQAIEWTASCARSDVVMRLYDVMKKELSKKHLQELMDDVEMPLITVLKEMEKEGVRIDTEYLTKQSKIMDKRLDEITSKIYSLAGEKFNINSPKQLQVILYEKLDLPASKRTKTGMSTDESVLKKLAEVHELPKSLLEYRELNKLKTAYYDSLLSLVDEKTQKIHARFNQAVTATGRISSSEPNLQNIPIKTEIGREIRKAFVPSKKGNVLLAADYSQIELRILAHLAEDNRLIGAFEKGVDVHKFTASEIFGNSMDEVTDKMRQAAKTVNFGIIYGMSAFGLAKDLNIPVPKAQEFITAYFDRYRGVKTFIDKTIEEAAKKGYVTTLLNRRRYIPEIKSSNERLRSFAERVAINTPVQGSAADLVKLAMIKCFEKFEKTDIKMIIQVHDELVFDIPAVALDSTAKTVKKIMESIFELKVPLIVNLEAGKNWMEMEELGCL
ncbi:MAG: DNA polymerase I [Candidatus Omnitrophica bacterium]|nr:DNA polymerase I [Candidatus Omnitrophota bacterium]